MEYICNDGTKVVQGECTNCKMEAPCLNNGGVNENPTLKSKLTKNQKWGIVIGGTLLAYYILHKAGTFK
jgi:hypothetical protein